MEAERFFVQKAPTVYQAPEERRNERDTVLNREQSPESALVGSLLPQARSLLLQVEEEGVGGMGKRGMGKRGEIEAGRACI